MRFLCCLLVVACIVGCTTTVPVRDLQNESIPTSLDGSSYSTKDVEKAILSATRRRGWSPRLIKPGLIEASISIRTHRAKVEIPYSSSGYSINFKDSENLDYRKGNIHPSYNKWIVLLSSSIQREFGVKVQNF